MGKIRSWIYPVVGWSLIGHFVFCLCRSLYLGELENVLWISHLGTLIGGLGACLRNRRLISLALVTCFWHHLFWIFDTLTWLITGEFAVGATAYLQNRSLSGWIQSANHFFTIPALFFLSLFQGGIEKNAWIWSSLLFLFSLAISLIFLPPASNVNCAHQPWPGLEKIISQFFTIDPFSLTRYLIFIITFTVFGNYLPTNLILGYIISRCVVSEKRIQNDSE